MRRTICKLLVGCMLAIPGVSSASTLAQEMQHDTRKPAGEKSGMKNDDMKEHDNISGDMKKDGMTKDKKMKKSKKTGKEKMEKKDGEMKSDPSKE